MKPTKVTLTFDNGAEPIELPILSGSNGPDVIDIRSLGKHGILLMTPAFVHRLVQLGYYLYQWRRRFALLSRLPYRTVSRELRLSGSCLPIIAR